MALGHEGIKNIPDRLVSLIVLFRTGYQLNVYGTFDSVGI